MRTATDVRSRDEVRMLKGQSRGVTVMNDLSFVVARFDGMTARFSPTGFDAKGAPRYDLAKAEKLGPAGGQPPSSGGDQALTEAGGWTVTTNAVAPFSPYGLGGTFHGEPRWSYPSAWPGLHASHEAAVPDRPGMVVGHTRLLGGWVKPAGEAGPMFCINGNMGNMYLFTADGLFVAHALQRHPPAPELGGASRHPQHGCDGCLAARREFLAEHHADARWPRLPRRRRTHQPRPRGRARLGANASRNKRSPSPPTDLERARDWFASAETARQQARGSGILGVPLRKQPPQVDGKLDDWPATTDWAAIDRRGTKANFNSNSRPYDVSAAVCVSGDRLFAAWRTTEKDLLNNSGETPNALFKTGGCLDLMLQADTDERLLVTLVKGKPRAMLYRAKVPGTTQPVAFSSPWRTINIDVVEDVTAQVAFATDGSGNFEISIPLQTLHWQPKPGDTVRADLGVLRGSNCQTTQRVYWANKATAITADVPSEAELTPKLWGKWRVLSE